MGVPARRRIGRREPAATEVREVADGAAAPLRPIVLAQSPSGDGTHGVPTRARGRGWLPRGISMTDEAEKFGKITPWREESSLL